jgi:hypothetical protein
LSVELVIALLLTAAAIVAIVAANVATWRLARKQRPQAGRVVTWITATYDIPLRFHAFRPRTWRSDDPDVILLRRACTAWLVVGVPTIALWADVLIT